MTEAIAVISLILSALITARLIFVERRLSAAELRGASLQQYLKTLDLLGVPGEVTLTWVTQLPV